MRMRRGRQGRTEPAQTAMTGMKVVKKTPLFTR
jgi:hypothetical protein